MSKSIGVAGVLVLALIAAWFVFAHNTPAPPCQSLQSWGAIKRDGRCYIKGNVELKGAIQRLPDQLTVQGNLKLNGTAVEVLPRALVVEGHLVLYKTSISRLPLDLQVDGDLDTYGGFGSPGILCADIAPSVVIKGQRGCQN